MSNCSKHKKEVAGISDMKQLAEMIGDLHYGTMTELFLQLAIKINTDGVNDINSGRNNLGRQLYLASNYLEVVYGYIQEAWEISEPFMHNNEPNAQECDATEAK